MKSQPVSIGTRIGPPDSVRTSLVCCNARMDEISRNPFACAVYVIEDDSILVVGLSHSARRPASTETTLEDRAGRRPAGEWSAPPRARTRGGACGGTAGASSPAWDCHLGACCLRANTWPMKLIVDRVTSDTT